LKSLNKNQIFKKSKGGVFLVLPLEFAESETKPKQKFF
jgi:hypothetical protein